MTGPSVWVRFRRAGGGAPSRRAHTGFTKGGSAMTSSPRYEHIRQLIDTDLPPGELERLARVDRLLRAAAGARPALTLKLGFRELALIYRSLQAAKTLGAPPLEDELLDDTIELVDRALQGAI
jgi:hypothetical protein